MSLSTLDGNERRKTFYGRIEAIFVLLVVSTSFGMRILTIPWDFGGTFLHVFSSIVIIGYLGSDESFHNIRPKERAIIKAFLYPLFLLNSFGSLYFAPQSLFPFCFFGLALVAAISWRARSKMKEALLATILLLPLLIYWGYGIKHMLLIVKIRTLNFEEVSSVVFKLEAEEKEHVVIKDADTIERILESLGGLYPYSPNHESIQDAWSMFVNLNDGSRIEFLLGKGNKAHPEAAWIEFGAEVYQNLDLFKVLNELDLGLWKEKADPPEQTKRPNDVENLRVEESAVPQYKLVNCKVTEVIDGHALVVLVENKDTVKLKLDGIATPKKGSPFYEKAKEHMEKLVTGKTLRMEVLDSGHDEFSVGYLLDGEKDIAIEMIKAGYARVSYFGMKQNCHLLPYCAPKMKLEEEARKKKVGVWASPDYQ